MSKINGPAALPLPNKGAPLRHVPLDPIHPDPTNRGPVNCDLAPAHSADANPAQSSPARSEPTNSGSVNSDAVKPGHAQAARRPRRAIRVGTEREFIPGVTGNELEPGHLSDTDPATSQSNSNDQRLKREVPPHW